MTEKILLAGAVRGLVSEGGRIIGLIEKESPDALALSVSREGLETMVALEDSKPNDVAPVNPEEEVYMCGLSEFGEVVKPPPCFSMAQRYAIKAKIPVEALDMDDEHYTAAYCKYVSTLDMIRQGNSGKQLAKHAFMAETPEQFVIEWDNIVNKYRGYRELENAREIWLAKGISALAEKHGSIMAVVEFERLAGVKRQLESLGQDYETIH